MARKALICAPVAYYLCEPRMGSEPDDEGWYGQEVELLGESENGFYRIRTPYNYETYAHESALCTDEAELERYAEGKVYAVWARCADIHTEESYKNAPIETLWRGAAVVVTEEPGQKNGWAKVRLIGGREGYVKSGLLGNRNTERVQGEELFRAAVVKAAMLYEGTQYRWGGKSPMGIDCSGLAGAAYLMCGVGLYRNASIKEGWPAREIDPANMKKGDLIYFKGHVAIYLGDGKYIHSTSRMGDDGVTVNSLVEGDKLYRDDLAKGIIAVGSIF